MEKNSKLFLAFGVGALIGAGLVALFTTDKGKALVEKAKGGVDDLTGDLKKTIKDLEDHVAEILKGEEPKENTQG